MEMKPLSGKEYDAIKSLFAAISHLSVLVPVLEKRAKMVPNLWRDLKMLQSVMETVIPRMLTTVPSEKLIPIHEDIRHTKMYIRTEAPGIHSMTTDGFSYLPTKTLNSLLGYACDHECMMCDRNPRDAKKNCEVRKMLDSALPHDIRAVDGEHCKYSDFTLGFETDGEAV